MPHGAGDARRSASPGSTGNDIWYRSMAYGNRGLAISSSGDHLSWRCLRRVSTSILSEGRAILVNPHPFRARSQAGLARHRHSSETPGGSNGWRNTSRIDYPRQSATRATITTPSSGNNMNSYASRLSKSLMPGELESRPPVAWSTFTPPAPAPTGGTDRQTISQRHSVQGFEVAENSRVPRGDHVAPRVSNSRANGNGATRQIAAAVP